MTRDAAEVIPEGELRGRIAGDRALRVKLGCDPTAGHVHLGWAVVLRKLRQFQDFGHTAVLIVGDFTARIGDPSGQNKTRPMLTRDEVDAHAKALLDQFMLILDPERLEVRYNSEWLEPLGVGGLLELSTVATVAQMLQREDFSKRFDAGTPITVTEFLYPLLQAYDSVAVEADVELGGTDQTFNLLVGRDVQRHYEQAAQSVLTMPLLEGTDGAQKMSQSLGNYIAITENPDDMYGKLMRVPDELLEKYLRLTTELPEGEVDTIVAGVEMGELRPEAAKRRLAKEVTRLYHGTEAAREAETRFDRLFVSHEIPADVPEADVPGDCVTDGTAFLPKLLKGVGLAPSTAEGRRLIAQGGVRLDGEKVATEELAADDLRGRVLQVGKRRFLRLR